MMQQDKAASRKTLHTNLQVFFDTTRNETHRQATIWLLVHVLIHILIPSKGCLQTQWQTQCASCLHEHINTSKPQRLDRKKPFGKLNTDSATEMTCTRLDELYKSRTGDERLWF